MNCVDRLVVQLSRSLRPSQFQLVGAVCLFIASKLRDCSESVSLSAKKLADYSDSSFTSRQLIVRLPAMQAGPRRQVLASKVQALALALALKTALAVFGITFKRVGGLA